eukprot:CAMPEP_0114546896 /NCGR_PEP_ID=MMETSP0114-20121206/4176_1 /TAXON_ID=31324 /ORGANISM="Goniomonas sp, Strain m" /LENGTH=49 /DNA_ID= /DNA_START= /DNA_END= /DNA_ORIENTATION=
MAVSEIQLLVLISPAGKGRPSDLHPLSRLQAGALGVVHAGVSGCVPPPS